MAVLQWAERTLYKAGERVPVSGIYRVAHIAHRGPHEVLAIVDEEFPSCRICRNGVSFQVLHPVGYVNHDWDLVGPVDFRRQPA